MLIAFNCLAELPTCEGTQQLLEDAQGLFQQLGDPEDKAQCLHLLRLSKVLYMQGKYSAAQSMLEDAQGKFEQLGDKQRVTRCIEVLGEILECQITVS